MKQGSARMVWDVGLGRYTSRPNILTGETGERVSGLVQLVASEQDQSLWFPVEAVAKSTAGSPMQTIVCADVDGCIPIVGGAWTVNCQTAQLLHGGNAIAWPASTGGTVTVSGYYLPTVAPQSEWTCTRYVAPPPGVAEAEVRVPPFAVAFRLLASPVENGWTDKVWSIYGAANRYAAQYPFRSVRAALAGRYIELPPNVGGSLYTAGAPHAILADVDPNNILAFQFLCSLGGGRVVR